jgi:nucleoside phosphorylase
MEAGPLLDKLSRMADRHESDDVVSRFQIAKQEVLVAVIGMGKTLARQGTLRFLERFSPECIINAGIAGALSDKLEVGCVYRVSSAVDWPSLPDVSISFSERRFESLRPAGLVTVDEPVFDDELRLKLSVFGELVDMEGAVIAEAAAAANIECVGIKCISDFAKDGDRNTLHANLHRASTAIAEVMLEKITR